VRSLSAAIPLLLAQEVSYRSATSNLDIVNSLHHYTVVIAVNSSIQKTYQYRPTSYSIESIRYVEDQATVEVTYLKREKKHLCMATEPDVIREIEYDSGSDVSTETSCLKRREQKENATFASTGYYILWGDSECPNFEWGL
jgi:hypothetical protein